MILLAVVCGIAIGALAGLAFGWMVWKLDADMWRRSYDLSSESFNTCRDDYWKATHTLWHYGLTAGCHKKDAK